MISQHLFDALADALVEAGRPVSYSTMQRALEAHRGFGTSDRDLRQPYADWLRRRRYRPHLALLDLSLDMEKAIAGFVELSTRQADERAAARQGAVQEALRARVAELETQVAGLSERNRTLEGAAAAAASGSATRGLALETAPTAKRQQRKRGTSAATSRFFWDRVIREIAALIRRQGPQELGELLAAIAPDDIELAAAAFRPIDRASLEKALGERTRRERHRLTRLDDGRYGLLPPRRRADR